MFARRKMLNRSRSFKSITLGIIIAVLAVMGSVATASSAQAYPSGCSAHINTSNGGFAQCTGGSGQVQVVLGCENPLGWWSNPVGDWVNVGAGTSRAGCPLFFTVRWAGYYLRD